MSRRDKIASQYFKEPTARNKALLVKSFTPLIKSLAGKNIKKVRNTLITFEDFMSVGYEGLLKALDRFEPERGHKFITFAHFRIRGAMLDYARRSDPFTRAVRDTVGEANKVKERLSQKLGRFPSDKEIAYELDLDLKEFNYLYHERGRQYEQYYYSKVGSEKDDIEFLEFLRCKDLTIVEEKDKEGSWDIFITAFLKLNKNTRTVLIKRYFDDIIFKDIGKQMGFTEARASQLHNNALEELRSKLNYHAVSDMIR